jgi:hypothetical protein
MVAKTPNEMQTAEETTAITDDIVLENLGYTPGTFTLGGHVSPS